MSDPKVVLHRKLREERAALLRSVDGLGEYDRRRPMTPTGTNLLGLVKHLTGIEYGYLGSAFGRPAPTGCRGSRTARCGMAATCGPGPTRAASSCSGCTGTPTSTPTRPSARWTCSSPGYVAHWPEAARHTDLGVLLVRVVAETAHHAGHADIVREMIDGRGGSDHDGLDAAGWERYLAQVTAAADAFR